MTTPIYQQIARSFVAYQNCLISGNTEWGGNHKETIESLASDHLPSGSGFDSGSTFDFEASKPNRLVFNTSFHHMTEHGYYDGWTEHSVIVTPDLHSGFNLHVTGRDRREIKEYIGDITTFLEARNVGDLKALEAANLKAKTEKNKDVSEHQLDYKAKKQWQKNHRKAKNRSGKLEKAIDDLEKDLNQHDDDLLDPVKFKELSGEAGFFEGYEEKQKELAKLMTEWEQVVEEVEELEKQSQSD